MASKKSDGRTYQRTHKTPDGLRIKSGPYWIEYYDSCGDQHRESTGLFDFKAADAIRFQRISEKRRGIMVAPKARKVTVGELLDDLLIEVKRSGKHEELAAIHCKRLRSFFGEMIAARIGTDQFDGYIERRLQEGVCGGTVNRELTRLRRAFQIGTDREPPKVLRVPKIRKLAENPARTGFFEREDYELLLSELPEDLKPVLAFGYYSGCRPSEVLSLKWEQVDLAAGGIIRLRSQDTKTKEARLFAAPGQLLEMVKILAEKRTLYWPDCAYVFTRAGRPIKDFRGAWEAATERAGIGRRLFHDLRRTAVRNMVRAGVPEDVAMRISGHKSHSVFQRYNIVSERDMIEAGARLDVYLTAVKDKTRTTASKTAPAVH